MTRSAEQDAIFWDVLRERDHYRARCGAAVERIERASGTVTDATGGVVGIVLPVEVWRSIRASLQEEPHVVIPREKRTS